MKINIKGSIMGDRSEWLKEYGYQVTTPSMVIDAIEKADGEEIELYINSPGGSTSAASEIYSAIKEYQGNVVAKIVGYAASAASYISLAANKVSISPTGLIMIHNASTQAWGDNREMESAKNMLIAADKSIRNALKIKTKLSDEKLEELMNKETWLTAEEAVENNFADEIMFEEKLSNSNILEDMQIPSEVIVNMIKNKNQNKKESEEEMEKDNVVKNEVEELTINSLKENYKDIYDEIFNEGAKSERERIQKIEDLGVKGFEDLVDSAKYKKIMSPENLAMEIIKNQKGQGISYLKDVQDEKATVVVDASIQVDEKEKEKEVANLIAESANR